MKRYAVKVHVANKIGEDGPHYVDFAVGLTPDPQRAHLYIRRDLAQKKVDHYFEMSKGWTQWYNSAEIVEVTVEGFNENDIAKRLRIAIQDIRRRPYPISDLIPLMAEAADELDNLAVTLHHTADVSNQALETIKIVSDNSCQKRLQQLGKPYPRTCAICGLTGKCGVE